MYLQTTLLCALLAATTEAGPLGSVVRREGAQRHHLARRNGTEPSSSSKVLDKTPTTTVVTFVPGDLLSVTTKPFAPTAPESIPSSSLSLASTLTLPITSSPPSSSTLPSSTAAQTSPTEVLRAPISSPAASSAAGSSPVAEIPTIVTDIPSPTSTVTPTEFADNVAQAKDLNSLFSTLTGQSACAQGQAACIDGSLAFCSNGKTFDLLPCPTGTGCYALPMTTTEGVGLGCVSKAAAEELLGGGAAPGSPAASSALSSPASSAPSSSAASEGQFTRTATVTQSSGIVTVTMTVDPNRSLPAADPTPTTSSSSRRAARPTDVLEVFPINDDEPTTTLTTTLVQTSATTVPAVPAVTGVDPGESASEVPPRPTRTRTRNRGRPTPTATATEEGGVQPTPTETGTDGGNGGGNRGGQPQPTLPPPNNPDRGAPGDDTRVTFTLTETVRETVTEKEVVTVTVSGVQEAGTVVVIKRGW